MLGTEPANHLALGRHGEALALAFLERAGYDVVATNFVLPIGRNTRGVVITSEIDIVAYDGMTLCFVEVKTRASDWFAPPEIGVD
ncbi:MAG: YraN family protein, partial [Pyrinomonadaceae bacterium]